MRREPLLIDLQRGAAALRREWEQVAAGSGDVTLTRLNERLIEFNHYFHRAAQSGVPEDALLQIIEHAFPAAVMDVALRRSVASADLTIDGPAIKEAFKRTVSKQTSAPGEAS